jgi:ABC-type transporter Mla subunit MlaD
MKRRNEFLVGLTVIIAFAVVVAGTIWLSQTDLGNRDLVQTARFREIGGLGVGAPVTVRGVKVGQVNAIRLTDGGWVEADLKIRSDLNFRLTLAITKRLNKNIITISLFTTPSPFGRGLG